MQPIISAKDYNIIRSIVTNLPHQQKTREVGELMQELEKAQIIDDGAIDDDIIRINSKFEVEVSGTGKVMRYQLVLPRHADLASKKISILSPLGVILIGFRQGMLIDWVSPGGPKQLKILKVDNTHMPVPG